MDTPDAPLTADDNARLCEGCVRCCSYITVEIDKPRTPREYDQWIWALHHRGISLYVERPEAWYVHVDTTCERLDAHGRCSIHGRHPVLCREYDARTCERRLPLSDIVAWFDTAAEFEAWIRHRRPAHWRRLEAFRAKAAGQDRAMADAHAHAPRAARARPAPARGDLIPVASLLARGPGRTLRSSG
jgi:Fe-S-cluster containining protein